MGGRWGTGVTRLTFYNTPATASFGALLGLFEADQMRQLERLDEAQVRQLLIQSLESIFGAHAAKPTQIILQRWDVEEFSRGGPVAYASTGVLTDYGTSLREPAGRIHFAGTESPPYWTGYMDGAIRSVERVVVVLEGL
jgi:monoamine oxidase